MSEYQVLARKYRPKTFSEVLGQDSIVTTLKNAIKYKRLAHAYLFCGSRGTGKTTLARVFAKALNCINPTVDFEPCNACSSCKEINVGNSLDVLEIDGASNRGIDDIRQINETVGYAAASGKYKIYIIDEVHMLTKEAFNALLKTLEEPPPKVKFFFATTEPHKVLPTILSRCQRFNLSRIPAEKIIGKLQRIAEEMKCCVEEEALRMIANHAEGGLRDAESLLDQILAFHDNETVTAASISSILGVMPRDTFFELDRAGKDGRLATAFEIVERIFSQGKDLLNFVEMLTEHFRNILIVKLSGPGASPLSLSETERKQYDETAKLYRKDQCMALLDYLVEMQSTIRSAPSARIALEAILLHVLRSHSRIPVDVLVQRLVELESKLNGGQIPAQVPPPIAAKPALPPQKAQPPSPPLVKKVAPDSSVSIDPTPTPADLGLEKPSKPKAPEPLRPQAKEIASAPVMIPPEEQCRCDTVMQFAAIELEGTIQKKPQNLKK